MSTTRLITALLITAGTLGAGTACRSADPTLERPYPRVTPTVATSPAVPGAQDAVAAYRGMWAAFVEAAKTSNPDAPEVSRYANGDALRLIVTSLHLNRSFGRVTLGELLLDPKVTATEPAYAPTEVTIDDCVNDEKWLVYSTSGKLISNGAGSHHRVTATVRKTAEGWRVAMFTLQVGGTC